ncbi:hypothetical protein D5E69_22775 (plasmid) [Rossellomorea marisflavi]|uniref:hypothetical protein n=1 Tax=Rossellomorea marisflavi TaxID=189381 RepID=UPI0013174FF1|nr:hypothetical protein [Rossellomorea marisflavi]QHA38667.1 hypothetical protein D5E69_22775 [Rossellomorea marisflavi]
MLIPVTLTDNRVWYWQSKKVKTATSLEINKRLIANTAIWAIRFQIAIIYLNSTIAKLGEKDWINGTAVYYYLQDPMLGKLTAPILTTPLVALPTWGTLNLQFFLFAALREV